MNEEGIEIINFNKKLREEYKINKPRVIEEENLELLLDNKNSDKIVIRVKIIKKFIIIISVKIKNQLELKNKNVKEIQLDSFNMTIIKYDSENNQNQQININIPIKGEINISTKDFYNQKFYFFDLVPIEDFKGFFYLYIFNQIHFYKLYQKDGQLKYNKIKVKNFNNDITVLYLGKNFIKEKNILEVELLLKPNNYFCYIPIDTSNENKKYEVKEYLLEKKEYKNIFNKFIKSNCEFFIFSDKKENKKYIVSAEEKTKEIQIKELNLNNFKENTNSDLKILCLFKILDIIYVIADITKNNKNDDSKYLTFGIYNLLYSDKDDNYYMELQQQINIINNEGIKEYDFNINDCNYISINIGTKLYFIHLNQNGAFDMINSFQIDSEKLNIRKYQYDKSQDLSLFILFKNKEIYISRFIDDFYKEEKCISNENKTNIVKEQNNNYYSQIENESTVDHTLINHDSIEKKEVSQINLIENIHETKNDNYIKNKIEMIIKERIEKNKYKINKLVEDKKRKIKAINSDIKSSKEENKCFKVLYDNIMKVIINLQKIKNENNNYNDEEEEEEKDNKINYKFNLNYNNRINNSMYQSGMNPNYNNNINLINHMNNSQQQNMNYNFPNFYQLNPQSSYPFYPKRNMMMNNINNNFH